MWDRWSQPVARCVDQILYKLQPGWQLTHSRSLYHGNWRSKVVSTKIDSYYGPGQMLSYLLAGEEISPQSHLCMFPVFLHNLLAIVLVIPILLKVARFFGTSLQLVSECWHQPLETKYGHLSKIYKWFLTSDLSNGCLTMMRLDDLSEKAIFLMFSPSVTGATTLDCSLGCLDRYT